MLAIVTQLFVNGLIAGAIYALVASGFSLIYSTNKFIHFAHGSVLTCGGYALFLFYVVLEYNFIISLIISIFFTSFLGYFINLVVYRQLRKKKSSSMILLISSVSVLTLLNSLILLLFGPGVKNINYIKNVKIINFLQAKITLLQIFIIIISLLLLLFLFIFVKKTKLGKAMRAVSNNKNLSEILGISSEKIYSLSFVVGSAIAGISAVLISLEQNLEPNTGFNLMIKGFVASVIGRVDSVYGSVLGAFMLGIIENFGVWYLPAGYKDAIAFVLLFIFLLFRQNGLFGLNNKKI